jgi:hypothetical protein
MIVVIVIQPLGFAEWLRFTSPSAAWLCRVAEIYFFLSFFHILNP